MRRKRIRNRNLDNNKKSLSGKIIWLLVGVFIVLQIFFTIQTSTLGATLADLERREKELLAQNEDLTNKIVQSSSLISVQKNAKELGYVKPELTIYLSSQESVAQLNP